MMPAVLVPSVVAVLCDVGDGWVLELAGRAVAEGGWAAMSVLVDWWERCCAETWRAMASPVIDGWAEAA